MNELKYSFFVIVVFLLLCCPSGLIIWKTCSVFFKTESGFSKKEFIGFMYGFFNIFYILKFFTLKKYTSFLFWIFTIFMIILMSVSFLFYESLVEEAPKLPMVVSETASQQTPEPSPEKPQPNESTLIQNPLEIK